MTRQERPIRNHIQGLDIKPWAEHWNVRADDIRAAIEKVGNSVGATFSLGTSVDRVELGNERWARSRNYLAGFFGAAGSARRSRSAFCNRPTVFRRLLASGGRRIARKRTPHVAQTFTFAAAAYNLVRLPKLTAEARRRSRCPVRRPLPAAGPIGEMGIRLHLRPQLNSSTALLVPSAT